MCYIGRDKMIDNIFEIFIPLSYFWILDEQVHDLGARGGGGADPDPLRDAGLQHPAGLPLRPLLHQLPTLLARGR